MLVDIAGTFYKNVNNQEQKTTWYPMKSCLSIRMKTLYENAYFFNNPWSWKCTWPSCWSFGWLNFSDKKTSSHWPSIWRAMIWWNAMSLQLDGSFLKWRYPHTSLKLDHFTLENLKPTKISMVLEIHCFGKPPKKSPNILSFPHLESQGPPWSTIVHHGGWLTKTHGGPMIQGWYDHRA